MTEALAVNVSVLSLKTCSGFLVKVELVVVVSLKVGKLVVETIEVLEGLGVGKLLLFAVAVDEELGDLVRV